MILLIESGSTNTHWRLLDPKNPKPTDFHSKGINPYYQSGEEILEVQLEVLNQLKEQPVERIFYFGTGITGQPEKDLIHSIFNTIFPKAQEIAVHNDLESAAISCLGNNSGIACILGTGANSGFFENRILVHQVPPLGFWLGDEGSGGHLGKSLILAYLHKELPEDLRQVFNKRFGELSRTDILHKAYKEPFPNRWFANFSKFLFDHRKHPFVYQLIKDSFQQFVEKYLLKYPQAKQSQIHFTGSVAFFFSDILKSVLKEYGLAVGIISEGPMAGLTLYYKNEWFREI